MKRVTSGSRIHERCDTELTVIPVELDDVDSVGDLCRTFSLQCALEDIENTKLLCTLANYLNQVGVHGARWELDVANRRIVVIVSSIEGTSRLRAAAYVLLVL